jgi:type IV pilus assembly protein PilY1
MNPMLTSLQCRALERAARKAKRMLSLAVALALAFAISPPAHAVTALADQPLFATKSIPGNLALLLSVEYPTAISAAHTNRTYSTASEYLGYFDPRKCYVYQIDSVGGTTTANNYFAPSSVTANHVCNTTTTGQWSGNFLNWATMQTIDPFRWVLTGGYRVLDTDTGLTVVEKAWGTTDGSAAGNFPDASINSTILAGATPFAAYSGMSMRVWGAGNKMKFSLGTSGFPMTGLYYNNNGSNSNKNFGGSLVLTRVDNGTAFITGGVSPGPGVNAGNYSVRWTGKAKATTAGTYSFQTYSDDGVRLYVNGSLIIDNFTDHAPVTNTGTIAGIAAGADMDIKLEFYQAGGAAVIDLKWKPPGATTYSAIASSTPTGDLSAAATHYTGSNAAAGSTFEVFVRAKTCDPVVGLEENCVKYGSNYKPEGLMQFYSNKIRYSAFGYLNDNNLLRDGGVLRAQQKFIGPTKPVPNLPAIANAAAEWSSSTGQFTFNPDATDAANTKSIMGLPDGSEVTNSGALNYLNKFGEINASTSSSYKSYDPVSELYYGALRYFRNIAPVPEWTSVAGASDAQKIKWTDNFPVITSPADPILYSCQRNFILGIGDTNTHADKNLPGNTPAMRANEPALPNSVRDDVPSLVVGATDAVDATNKVGVLEGVGGGSLGTINPYNGCCNNKSALMGGLAYAAHVNDIRGRPFGPGQALSEPQTVDTYWVDVQEGLTYANQNQYYLAAKYGGFTKPTGYTLANTTPLLESQWHTNTDTFGTDKRPDNYFSGGKPDAVKAGLEAAFAKIAAAVSAFTTSFSTSLPQLAGTNNASYSGQYDPKNWTGEMSASRLSFDTTASAATVVPEWKFTDQLALQLAASNAWSANRFVMTWAGAAGTGVAFRASGPSALDSSDLAKLDTLYVTGNDSSDYVNYLRGDKSNEVGGTGKKVYRARDKLVGDIVGSKLTPNGPPSFPFSDSSNPGYGAFKTTWATRRTVVYFGSNDGMMHAVNGAFATTSAAVEKDANFGQEMFTYIPRELFQGPTSPGVDGLASLGNPGFVHHYMVDATPTVSDVDFSRVPNGANAKQSPVGSTYDWRSVLIGGLGKGGKAYYAIDVTDPVSMAVGTSGATENNSASKVLWEFSNSTSLMSGELGFTYGDPLVMKTKKYGWVVVFTSGYNNSDGKGYFFFVNPKTGALLEKVTTNTGSLLNDAGLAHAEAFIVDSADGTADAIYAGDLLGNLWRLDVTSTTGTYGDTGKLVKMAVLTDASTAPSPQPVTTRPAIEVSPISKKRYVMVGTGRLLHPSDTGSTQGQTFYAFTDGTNATFNSTPFAPAATPGYPIVRDQLTVNTTPATPIIFDPAPNAGWLEELGLDRGTPATTSPSAPAIPSTGYAYRIVTPLKAASGSVAFAATLPSSNICTPSGTSDIYARDFSNAQSTLDGRIAYYSLLSLATDLSYVSVGGKLRLVAGTDKGGSPQVIPIVGSTGTSLRRLNWRELQVVD